MFYFMNYSQVSSWQSVKVCAQGSGVSGLRLVVRILLQTFFVFRASSFSFELLASRWFAFIKVQEHRTVQAIKHCNHKRK